MKQDLIQSQASFGLHLDGENEIDANLLSNTIRDIAELTKIAAKEENFEAYLKINVTAFRNGSFQIDFSTICEVGETLITIIGAASAFALTIVGIVKGYLEIKKLLKGEKPKNTVQIQDSKMEVENNIGQKVIVHKSSVAILTNVTIDQLTMNIANYVQEYNPSGGFTFLTQEGNVICLADDVKNISKPITIAEETLCKRLTVKADLPIKKVDLTGRSTWEFKYQGHVIIAKIHDEEWLAEVNSGNVPIRAGDYIKATLEIYFELDLYERPIPDSGKYNIIKVHGIFHNYSEQIKL
ncbi:MAG: hypothetical protein ACOYU3_07205 [Bacillota bacterium]